MPVPIKISSVHSFSDQSQKYPATSLVDGKNDQSSWRCHRWREYCWIILELEQQIITDSITITNDQSAFVEVYAGAETTNTDIGFKVLLPVFSSLSPSDSRERSNGKRKFVFKSKQLTQAKNEPCRYIKCVCWQPYNKEIRFGLHSVEINGTEYKNDTKNCDRNLESPYGRYKLIETKTFVHENFFTRLHDPKETNNKKQLLASKEEKKCTAVGELKCNGQEKNVSPSKSEVEASATKIRKNKLPETDPLLPLDSVSSSPVARSSSSSSEARQHPSASKRAKTNNGIVKEENQNVKNAQNAKPDLNKNKKLKETERLEPQQKKIKKSFEKLMSHVVFTISGYENPLRTELKDKALEMGGKYESKWNTHCTHLICADANASKYEEVKQMGGRIVSRAWIEESYLQRNCLPWQKYILEGSKRDNSESDDDADGETKKEVKKRDQRKSQKPSDGSADDDDDDDDYIYDLDTEEEEENPNG